MNIKLEENALVVLVGAMGTGKSTFCSRVFSDHQVVSTDAIRANLTGDFEDQTHNKEVFEILFKIIEVRVNKGLFTVVDSTGSQNLLDYCSKVAKKINRPYYILKFPPLPKEEVTEQRMKHRMKYLYAYFKQVAQIELTSFPNNATVIDLPKNDDGATVSIKRATEDYLIPNDTYVIVGDLHGESKIFEDIISRYRGRKIIFLGDLVDRGPDSYGTFRLIRSLKACGSLYAVPGNHDNKLYRYFKKWIEDTNPEKYNAVGEFDSLPTYGLNIAHGLHITLHQFYGLDTPYMNSYAQDFIEYYESLSCYLRIEKDKEIHIFAHAGVSESMIKGTPLTARDVSTALYKTFTNDDKESIDSFVSPMDKKVIVHLGHDYLYHQPLIVHSTDKVVVIKHDIGIGKRKISGYPELMVLCK